jgi:hypothetical protein
MMNFLKAKTCNIKRHVISCVDCLCNNDMTAQRVVCGPDSLVGIATRYGLEGPGIESRWGRDFPHHSRPVVRATQPPIQWVPGLSRG